MKPTGTIVLAAGGATRFGSPKLLAQWWGRPLVEWALRTAPDDGPRIAVVGKETATLRPLFAHYGFAMVRNPRPSRRPRVVARDRPRRGCPPRSRRSLVLLGDAPDIPASVIDRVRTAYRRENRAVAAAYDDVRGHPVVLPRSDWPLVPQTGERAGATIDAVLVECGDLAAGSADVDTPDDLFALAARRSNAEFLDGVATLKELDARLAEPGAVRAQVGRRREDPARRRPHPGAGHGAARPGADARPDDLGDRARRRRVRGDRRIALPSGASSAPRNSAKLLQSPRNGIGPIVDRRKWRRRSVGCAHMRIAWPVSTRIPEAVVWLAEGEMEDRGRPRRPSCWATCRCWPHCAPPRWPGSAARWSRPACKARRAAASSWCSATVAPSTRPSSPTRTRSSSCSATCRATRPRSTSCARWRSAIRSRAAQPPRVPRARQGRAGARRAQRATGRGRGGRRRPLRAPQRPARAVHRRCRAGRDRPAAVVEPAARPGRPHRRRRVRARAARHRRGGRGASPEARDRASCSRPSASSRRPRPSRPACTCRPPDETLEMALYRADEALEQARQARSRPGRRKLGLE